MKSPKKLLICGLGRMVSKYYQIIYKAWQSIKLLFLIKSTGTRTAHIPCKTPIHTSISSVIKFEPDIALETIPAWNPLELLLANKSTPIFIEKPVGIDIDTGDSPLWDELLQKSKNIISFLNNNVDIVVTIRPSLECLWFNMLGLTSDGDLTLIESLLIEPFQESPPCLDLTILAYAYTPNFVLNSKSTWSGIVAGTQITDEYALDIDKSYDYKLGTLSSTENADDIKKP